MNLGTTLIFAMKPTTDAVFTLLFLGEYRQYTIGVCKFLRNKITGRKVASNITQVSEFRRKFPVTRSSMPSTVSGYANDIKDEVRPSEIARSSSVPVQLATISA